MSITNDGQGHNDTDRDVLRRDAFDRYRQVLATLGRVRGDGNALNANDVRVGALY